MQFLRMKLLIYTNVLYFVVFEAKEWKINFWKNEFAKRMIVFFFSILFKHFCHSSIYTSPVLPKTFPFNEWHAFRFLLYLAYLCLIVCFEWELQFRMHFISVQFSFQFEFLLPLLTSKCACFRSLKKKKAIAWPQCVEHWNPFENRSKSVFFFQKVMQWIHTSTEMTPMC